jgi:ribosomal protein S18 acetylase RimI-like enzyme
LKKKLEAEMKKLIGDSRNCVLKAVDDSSCAGGEIVGILSGGVRKHSLRYADKKFVYAYVLYVSPAYRRKGIARKLFRALFSWARCKGLKEIGLKTQARNAPALKAYRAFGFRDSFIELKKFV